MDSPHSIGFYASSLVALAGGLAAIFLTSRDRRALALFVSGAGVAGVYASLSAGFAAIVVLLSFAGCAMLLARPEVRTAFAGAVTWWRQLGAVGAAVLLAALAYAAFRGSFVHVTFNGGALGTAAVGRLLFERSAMAAEAIGAVVLVAIVGATVAWRSHDRSR